jgi:hypothetical protein
MRSIYIARLVTTGWGLRGEQFNVLNRRNEDDMSDLKNRLTKIEDEMNKKAAPPRGCIYQVNDEKRLKIGIPSE